MGEDAGVPCAVQKMQDGRSQGILMTGIPCLHLLPKMLTVVMKNRIVCSPKPGMEREETGVI